MEIPRFVPERGIRNRLAVRHHLRGVTVTGGLPEFVAGETVAADACGLPIAEVEAEGGVTGGRGGCCGAADGVETAELTAREEVCFYLLCNAFRFLLGH